MTFGHLWETAETRELFGDEGRTRIWLSVYGALAEAQGELGLIPREAADDIVARAREPVDLGAVGEETLRSGHSTLGLIRVLERDLDAGRGWVSFGATVQDVGLLNAFGFGSNNAVVVFRRSPLAAARPRTR